MTKADALLAEAVRDEALKLKPEQLKLAVLRSAVQPFTKDQSVSSYDLKMDGEVR
jgi:hypothetical protein